jgi:maltodextrin utilization protein YvdJ
VVLQSWLGEICPLTTWEMHLRARAGEDVYATSFIMHWVSELLYYQFPTWVFVFCYTIFGMLVVASWFIVRPRGF